MNDYPADQGWRMPAEWEAHEATWIAWPHHRADWPGKFAAIPWVYAEIVRHLHPGERVRILVNDAAARRRASNRLRRSGVDLARIDFYEFPTDRGWTRDSGPICVVRDGPDGRQVALTHWLFNAWSKYPNWQHDRRLPESIGAALGLPRREATGAGGRRLVLEGGSIDGNGLGCL